ncbi:Hypothetical predicted protein, partial [Prunus dulcis]
MVTHMGRSFHNQASPWIGGIQVARSRSRHPCCTNQRQMVEEVLSNYVGFTSSTNSPGIE